MAADARDDHGAADDELGATGFHARRLRPQAIYSKISGFLEASKRHGASRTVKHVETGMSHQKPEGPLKPTTGGLAPKRLHLLRNQNFQHFGVSAGAQSRRWQTCWQQCRLPHFQWLG